MGGVAEVGDDCAEVELTVMAARIVVSCLMTS
jgi:hypothetical protein